MVFFSNHNKISAVQSNSLRASTAAVGLTPEPGNRSSQILTRRLRAADRGGNTLANATTLRRKSRVVDSVSRIDTDFFKVVVPTPVNVRVEFKNRSNAVLVGSLLDSQGQVLSFNGTRLSTRIPPARQFKETYANIPSGTYYLRLATRSGSNAQYELKLNVIDPNAAPPSLVPDCGCGS